MTDGKRNLPASVAARLLNRAKQTGDVYQTLLTSFCFERFLYRLGKSDARERFVLKGAMLLRLWSEQPYRATRDLDLLRKGDGSFEAIRADIRTICMVPVAPDAVTFDADAIEFEAIRAEDEYAGTRATLPARPCSVRSFCPCSRTYNAAPGAKGPGRREGRGDERTAHSRVRRGDQGVPSRDPRRAIEEDWVTTAGSKPNCALPAGP